jgi:hypothetical protein
MSFSHPPHLPSGVVTQNLTSLAVESAAGRVSKYSTKCAVFRNALRLVVQKGGHAAWAQDWTQTFLTTEELIYIV